MRRWDSLFRIYDIAALVFGCCVLTLPQPGVAVSDFWNLVFLVAHSSTAARVVCVDVFPLRCGARDGLRCVCR